MSYGCYNTPRPTLGSAQPAQDGWIDSDKIKVSMYYGNPIIRFPRLAYVKFNNTTECQYSKTTEDAQCTGCKHKQNLE